MEPVYSVPVKQIIPTAPSWRRYE